MAILPVHDIRMQLHHSRLYDNTVHIKECGKWILAFLFLDLEWNCTQPLTTCLVISTRVQVVLSHPSFNILRGDVWHSTTIPFGLLPLPSLYIHYIQFSSWTAYTLKMEKTDTSKMSVTIYQSTGHKAQETWDSFDIQVTMHHDKFL